MELALRQAYAGGNLGGLGFCDEFGYCWDDPPSITSSDPVYAVDPYELSPNDPILQGEGSAAWEIAHPSDPNRTAELLRAITAGARGLTPGAGGAHFTGIGPQPAPVKPWLPGISNQTLMIGGVALFALLMLGKKR